MRWADGKESVDGDKASTENAPGAEVRDVFVYFDNDLKVKSPEDAMALQGRIDAVTLREERPHPA